MYISNIITSIDIDYSVALMIFYTNKIQQTSRVFAKLN